MADIVALLKLAKSRNAPDLHLVAHRPPLLRINGSLLPVGELPDLSAEDINQALRQMASDKQMAEFERCMELDFGIFLADVGRIRFNAARQRGTVSMVMRLLPMIIPEPDFLGLPKICTELIMRPRGLEIISGPTGSGKSTTLASMIDYLNQVESRRVVTIEDPIEYTYVNKRCTITQREIGQDTVSFSDALRHVLRQGPDVILVGEMSELGTASAAPR